MKQPVYANNFQIFVAHGDKSTDGEATIQFNHVWRHSEPVHPVNPVTKEVDTNSTVPGNNGVSVHTDTVASVVIGREALYQLRDSLNAIITQMEVDAKMQRLSEE